jgi:hypothetical protein
MAAAREDDLIARDPDHGMDDHAEPQKGSKQ